MRTKYLNRYMITTKDVEDKSKILFYSSCCGWFKDFNVNTSFLSLRRAKEIVRELQESHKSSSGVVEKKMVDSIEIKKVKITYEFLSDFST